MSAAASSEPRVLDEWDAHDGDRLRIVEGGFVCRLQFFHLDGRGWRDTTPREHAYALFNRLCERADPPAEDKP